MKNTVVLSGRIKNIVERPLGQTGTSIVTATLNQSDPKTGKTLVTINLVGYEGRGAALLRALIPSQESMPLVTITGELDTLFDRRPGVEMSQRRAPWTRISVDGLEPIAQ